MSYILWLLPIVAAISAVASGRLSSIGAGLLGVLLAWIVAASIAPEPLGTVEAMHAAAQGLWLAALVGAVIFSGLFFKTVVELAASGVSYGRLASAKRRATCFDACFLIGPFTEAATGFGVGQVATVSILLRLGLAPLHIVSLALFSQILVPWGAMANGTMVGAALAGLPPAALGERSAILTVPLLLGWLPLFWVFAASAGLPARMRDYAAESACAIALAALLILGNYLFGPEVAGLAAAGTVIALRFAILGGAEPSQWRSSLRASIPYAALIIGLAASRSIPAVATLLASAGTYRPFPNLPGWSPFLHPSSWLAGVGIITAYLSGKQSGIPLAVRKGWQQGRRSVLAISLFLVMAQLMASSGIVRALADALREALGPRAALAAPVLGGAFGFLTGSSAAANGLLMQAQVAFAAATNLSVPWLAAVQNTAASAKTMLSPVRLAMGCALVGRPGLERAVYARTWPLSAYAIAILIAVCVILATGNANG